MPDNIENLEQLEEMLSRPSAEVVEMMRHLDGDIIFLGAGGKIGPSLARMASRACDMAGAPRRIIAVARFSSPELRQQLESEGIETIPCDLMDHAQLTRLPESANVFYLAAMKFGSTGAEATTWARNAYLPGLVCEKYRRSRIVAYSTGNVYPLTPVKRGGSVESDSLAPIGEYAMSCLGRERIFSYFSQEFGIPVALIRLNYACEMRYGVLVDLAKKIMFGESIDLSMGYFNVIWQGDNNVMTLLSLTKAASPPQAINITGPEILSVRRVAEQMAELLGNSVQFTGTESSDALLSNAGLAYQWFGKPRVGQQQLIRWVVDWCQRGGVTHSKSTRFEVRDGRF